jgi:photosystem II stability/assembly factor-like uncharacterized protein
MRAAIYARVSTADGRQDVENQLAELRRFASTQQWEIDKEYIDHESGGRADRREFRRLLDDAAQRALTVHEVRASPNRPVAVVAAAAVGLCTSSDGGATWVVEKAGLHVPHCSAVQFVDDDVLVSAAADPFAPRGAIYRRGLDEQCPLVKVAGGLPEWLDGKVDSSCIATHGSAVAVADMGGNVYVSADTGRTWSRQADGIPTLSSVLIV